MSIPRVTHLTRPRVILTAVVLAIAGALAIGQVGSAHAAAARTTHASAPAWAGGPRPTIVLEHGAWADASSWNGEIKQLQRDGFTVYAPPNPLRGLPCSAQDDNP